MGRINYSKTIRQAESIKELASDLGSQIKVLEGLYDLIGNEWCGPASNAYRRQLYSLIESMKATRKNITSLGGQIECAANEIQDEDQKIVAHASAGGGGSFGGGFR